jgi:hypothetical protein
MKEKNEKLAGALYAGDGGTTTSFLPFFPPPLYPPPFDYSTKTKVGEMFVSFHFSLQD